eukprot:GEMP01065390.1.p1 GENE.GEMP01065390.1~~GEMP01065390.1.p1  ORF type:complete len:301 (+),score=65.51 GEMP01065390.1:70-972(+)
MFRLASLMAVACATDFEAEFQKFAIKFDKVYSVIERAERLAIFTANLLFIEAENAKGTNSYSLGVTPFADRTPDEFKARMKTFKRPSKLSRTPYEFKNSPIPDEVDWVKKGAVNPVQDQGQCGSCWSFSAVGGLEGARAVFGEGLLKLSEEFIMDCDDKDYKCEGGWMDNAFDFVKENGLCTEDSYSYKCADEESEECQESRCEKHNCTYGILPGEVTGLVDISPRNLAAFKEALAQQPLSIAIEADTSVFQFYTGGVVTSEGCGTSLDHGVLAVGYGVDDGTAYFKVKNSWGPKWGEHG